MSRIAFFLLTSLLVVGCRKNQTDGSLSVVGFARIGATREDVEADLKTARARVINVATHCLEARLDGRRLQRPMNVKLEEWSISRITKPNKSLDPTAVSVSVFMRLDFSESLGKLVICAESLFY